MMGPLESAISNILRTVLLDVFREVFPSPPAVKSPSPQPNNSKERMLLRSSEAAKRLGISERLLFEMTRTGKLPSIRVGRLVRYSQDTIQQWIRKSESTEPRTSNRSRRPRIERQPKKSSHRTTKTLPLVRERQSKLTKPEQRTDTVVVQSAPTLNHPVEPPRDKPRRVVSFIAMRLGVPEESLPRLTNGELKRIADVDISTLSDFQYRNGELPSDAWDRLENYYREYIHREQ